MSVPNGEISFGFKSVIFHWDVLFPQCSAYKTDCTGIVCQTG